jgi:hypothetical protein
MAKKSKKEQTIIANVQFTYILKGDKATMTESEVKAAIMDGFRKLAGRDRAWDDVLVKDVKVFEKE